MSNEFESPWTELNFIEREILSPMDEKLLSVGPIKWIEFPCKNEYEWVGEANKLVMEFGGIFHSVYLRWAFAINGLHVAQEHYSSNDWLNENKIFNVNGIRNSIDGSGPKQSVVYEPEKHEVAELHGSTIPMLSAWAFCNMYSCLEEFIFKLFRIFLNYHPLNVLKGSDFKHGRALYRDRGNSAEDENAWQNYWGVRLDSWHRKKLYDGIEKTVNNLTAQSNIKIPKAYEKDFNYSDVAKTLGGISLIRNCFIHGVTKVPKELEEFCSDFRGLFFSYKEGEKFAITIHELETFDFSTSTFLQTLNQSFFEMVCPEVTNATNKFS